MRIKRGWWKGEQFWGVLWNAGWFYEVKYFRNTLIFLIYVSKRRTISRDRCNDNEQGVNYFQTLIVETESHFLGIKKERRNGATLYR